MRIGRISAAMVTSIAGMLLVSLPTPASAVQAALPHVVSVTPASYTPDVNDGLVETLAQSGSTVVAGGSFTSVSAHGSSTTQARQHVFAFTALTGAIVAGFNPTVNGDVDSVIAGPTAGTVIIGGAFSTVDGVNTKVALLNTSTGAIVAGWKAPAINGEVNTLVLNGGRLYVGGYFTTVGGQSRLGLAVLNPTTGAQLTYTVPSFTGHHNWGRNCDPNTATCAKAGTGIKAMDINPAGTRMVAIGNFINVTGTTAILDQVAVLNLTSTAATVDTTWATAAYTAKCIASSYDVDVRDVQFSPDGSYFVIAATGGGAGQKNTDGTQTSCDSAARYETNGSGTDVRPTWIDYTGNDTFLSLAVTGTAIYVGGHERWVNNSQGSDAPKEGAVPRPGMTALDPQNGMPLAWNPGRNPRGAGAYAMLATSDGLYVGSDTDWIGNFTFQRKKLAFFPLAGGKTLASNTTDQLPGNVYLLGNPITSPAAARSVSFDGTASGTPTSVGGVDWTTARGAFETNGQVYYGSTDGNFYQRSFDGTTFGPAVAIDPYDDPAWDDVQTGSGQTYQGLKSAFYGEMSSITAMFYSSGRVYYTKSGASNANKLFSRYFETDDGVMGADEFTLSNTPNFLGITGGFLSGSTFYYATATGTLMKVGFANGQFSGSPTVANSSLNWSSHGDFVFGGGTVPPPPTPPTAAFTNPADCSGDPTCAFDGSSSSAVAPATITSYSWDFGDSTAPGTGATPSHTYAADGTYTVKLTVTDSNSLTNSVSHDVTIANAPPPPPPGDITFVGASAADGSATSETVTVPAATQAGDQLLMFASYAVATTVTATPPAGWTTIGPATSNNAMMTSAFEKTAVAGDAGSSVKVTFSTSVKGSVTLADYTNATAVGQAASATDTSMTAHKSPTVSGLPSGSLAVTFWADKSTTTTSWTPPAGVTQQSVIYGAGGGAVSGLLVDSGSSAVGASYGGLTATTNVKSGSGASWTVDLTS
jgi:PKD repeat protein